MSEFAQFVREDRRLSILMLLAQSDDYSASHYLLHAALSQYGHACSSDSVRTDMGWLAEQGLVTVQSIGDVHVAKLTQRGDDVQSGRSRVAGVKRPRPER